MAISTFEIKICVPKRMVFANLVTYSAELQICKVTIKMKINIIILILL